MFDFKYESLLVKGENCSYLTPVSKGKSKSSIHVRQDVVLVHKTHVPCFGKQTNIPSKDHSIKTALKTGKTVVMKCKMAYSRGLSAANPKHNSSSRPLVDNWNVPM